MQRWKRYSTLPGSNQKSLSSISRNMACRRFFFVVPLLLVATVSAWSRDWPLQIKVLSAESRQFQGPPLVPRDCEWREISAYCYNSSPETYVENKMLVETADGEHLEIACTVYNQWSHCANLPVNRTFQARMTKHGLEIRYSDQDGKMRKQLYEILGKRVGKKLREGPNLEHFPS